MEPARLQELKQKVLHDKDLAPVWSFFLDHFGENSEFMALGELTDHLFVEAVLAQVGQQLFGAEGAVTRLLLTRIADQHFIHGGFSMGVRIGGVFYFEDAQIGLAAVADKPPSIEAKYARFSARRMPKVGPPSRN
jgi:hypothetical protein